MIFPCVFMVALTAVMGLALWQVTRPFDTSRTCTKGAACVQRFRGVVVGEDDGSTEILRNDTEQTVAVELEDSLRSGTRVEIEQWHGQIVGVWDTDEERQHRTEAWPDRAEQVGVTVMLAFCLALGTFVVINARRDLKQLASARQDAVVP